MCKLAFFQNPLTSHVDQFLLSPIFWDTHGGSGCRTRTNTEQIYLMPNLCDALQCAGLHSLVQCTNLFSHHVHAVYNSLARVAGKGWQKRGLHHYCFLFYYCGSFCFHFTPPSLPPPSLSLILSAYTTGWWTIYNIPFDEHGLFIVGCHSKAMGS